MSGHTAPLGPEDPLDDAAVYVWVGVFDGEHWPYEELRRPSYNRTGAQAEKEIPLVVEALEKAGFTRVEHARPAR